MNNKKIAIVQSNYIPWKGYFDLIASVDEFILYDDMQYTKRSWRSRNQIKTPQGLKWLTIPVKVKGKYNQAIMETEIIENDVWKAKHWKTLELNYRKSKYFEEIEIWLKPLYFEAQYSFLSVLNRSFLEAICLYLNINTVLSNSWEYHTFGKKSERLAELCTQAGGSIYVSGPLAKVYLNTEEFTSRDIHVTWFDYSGYIEYSQVWGDFVHGVSILDLLFNCGKKSVNYMKFYKT
jgi:hypothetical protein